MMSRIQKTAVALIFAGIAALFANVLFKNRDLLVEWSWAKPHGKFEEGASAALQASALAFLDDKNPGKVCLLKSVGRDDSFLYAGTGCGVFSRASVEGDSNFVATRFRYSGDHVTGMERPNPEAFMNSLHRLVPLVAFEKMRYEFSSSEYLKAGQVRTSTQSKAQ